VLHLPDLFFLDLAENNFCPSLTTWFFPLVGTTTTTTIALASILSLF